MQVYESEHIVFTPALNARKAYSFKLNNDTFRMVIQLDKALNLDVLTLKSAPKRQ